MQFDNRLLDDVARMFSSALGVAAGARGEAENLIRDRLKRLLADGDLVSRDEFETVKEMAAKARLEQEKLAARVAELEAAVAAAKASPGHF